MAVAKELLGSSLVERSSFLPASGFLLNHRLNKQQNKLSFSPVLIPSEKRRLHSRKAASAPIAAISEDLFKPVAPVASEKPVKFKVRAVVTVRKKNKEDFKETIAKHLDALTDKIGRNVVLQLVSTEIDPKTKTPKKSTEAVLKDWSKKLNVRAERVHYTAELTVDSNFGEPGAITVSNKHQNEFFLETITIEGFACGPVNFVCNSWVQSKKDHPGNRIFFSNKPYLPSDTPAGLKELREKELKELRGNGKGTRKVSDRIYDYDTYNDLGNPDKGIELARVVLGGENIPYPRRCRTGRSPTDTDMRAEIRIEDQMPIYVPRDEAFEESKLGTLAAGNLRAILHNLIPSIIASLSADNHDFKGFSHVDSLYKEGLLLKEGLQDHLIKKLPLPKVVRRIHESSQGLLRYDTPRILTKDKFAWLRDDEFARQAIAGINPVSIQRLEVFPPVSNLDPETYGPLESAIKEEHIMGQLEGMSVQQALEEKKLFVLDYHDIYLPFLERINAQDGRKAYATRTLFFLTRLGTLKPIAIELSLPYTGGSSSSPSISSPSWKRVLTPPLDATSNWLWQLAKAHVCSNDAGVHQLVNHWLRTHACLEPFILAAHRHLSAMHPIFKLLDPHMRYTMEINGLARQILINGGGVIESCFTPGQYGMEISAAAYRNFWRFDLEGLPADLVRRGMAVKDPTQPHGIKLVLEDYPYANDGLLIWSAIESWVRTYVNRYYPDSSTIRSDTELQFWYSEAINVGHADLRQESWWPKLSNPEDLTSVLTTLIWLASAQHAALNFGQYPYGGYVPNRPPLMRRLIPAEGDPDYDYFLADPQRFFLSALPSLLQTTQFMAVVDTLSTHSPDEEYLGERQQPSIWSGDAEMVEAFYGFSAEIRRVEGEIEKRNKDPSLKNRCGAGVLPYELLAPSSEPGITCRGVPNSVSI
ncbi:linoleate 13S-lipoxygenase 3-1, chloroplastic-like [Telopea speciosissima]|uniref:linoleate 13S-lipoxygenase 3-1, chloroplastic-like n=1 Tax=Telopea speciosissima TaxID=54955 RepID=UPI001CC62DDB|nr:linoleate 13S-lipoxygenase 3-1, chloroplastic-like [Telopea speciosissima]XP_043707320.1 linoleate 13S-lipoxygenase 3-1, chloroplastic-like [Telopea speciosissima]